MKQVKFLDLENDEVHGGILMDDGNILCASCGSIIEKDQIVDHKPTEQELENGIDTQILEQYEDWIDFSLEICGDLSKEGYEI